MNLLGGILLSVLVLCVVAGVVFRLAKASYDPIVTQLNLSLTMEQDRSERLEEELNRHLDSESALERLSQSLSESNTRLVQNAEVLSLLDSSVGKLIVLHTQRNGGSLLNGERPSASLDAQWGSGIRPGSANGDREPLTPESIAERAV